MADFTTTTNLSLKKPAVGGSSDKWGEYLNSDLDTIDAEIQSLKTASTSRSLESLSNVLDLTPTTGQFLQYDTANWKAATVTIPDGIEDLGNVTVSSPSDGEVLAWSASNARWENQSAGAATIPDGTITTAKLSASLQGQVNLILQTTGTPTDNQILQYNSTSTNWEFQDLPGGTISALSDTDVSGISNQDVLVYNSTSGDWVSRPLAIADVVGLQAELDAKLESSDLSVSSLTDTTITTTADNSVLVYDASDSKWKNEGPSTARTSLGLAIGADVQAYDADTTKNDVSNTFTANQIISVSDNTNAALRITQTGTGNALVVEDANSDSTPFVVGNTGNVGIGTASPTVPLQLAYTAGVPNPSLLTSDAAIITAENTAPGFAFVVASSSSSQRGVFKGTRARGTLAAPTVPISGDSTFSLLGAIYDGVITRATAAIDMAVDGAVSDGVAPQRIAFWTGEATNRLERMRIDSSGNVGIGTGSPSQKLDVSGNINATGALTLGTALAIAEGGTGATTASAARIALLPTLGTAGQVLAVNTGATDVEWINPASGGGSGTVTSVAISGTDGIEVDSGSPITTSGTIALGINAATLSSHLSLGTAATTAATDYATAAQGTLADSAVQPGDDAADLGSGSATDGYVLTADGAGGTAWEAASGGGGGITDGDKGDITVSSSGTVWTIDNAVVTNAKLSLSANDSNIKTALNASGSAPIYACRAWVNFNGTGTVAIRESGNVSSITDIGPGDYIVNFDTYMPDADYAVSGTASRSGGQISLGINSNTTVTNSAVRVVTSRTETGAKVDSEDVTVAIFR